MNYIFGYYHFNRLLIMDLREFLQDAHRNYMYGQDDREVVALGPQYAQGGIEYYEKVFLFEIISCIMRHIACFLALLVVNSKSGASRTASQWFFAL